MRQGLWNTATACLACAVLAGCETYVTGGNGKKPAASPKATANSGTTVSAVADEQHSVESDPDLQVPAVIPSGDDTQAGGSTGSVQLTGAENRSTGDRRAPDEAQPAAETVNAAVNSASPLPAAQRTFQAEGPGGALRISFDDLDLLKLLKMEPVTPDCVEKMPTWLRELNGKPIRIRGFMKPGLLSTGIPQFLLVRDTGLCCFGPAGKIYDLIAVTLAEGTTTDYIELRPFDVVGTFRIQLEVLEDEDLIFGLYYIDNAKIIQK